MSVEIDVDSRSEHKEKGARENANRKRMHFRSGHLGRFSGVYVFAAFILIFGLWEPHTFLTAASFKSLIADQSITGIVAIGVVFALSAGALDLSFGNNLGMCGVICGTLLSHHYVSVPAAIGITMVCGLIVGVINAWFVVKVGISSIVATLGMSSVLMAIIDWLTHGGLYINNFPSSFLRLVTPEPLGVPILGFYFLVIAVLGWYVLEHTPVGRRVLATGSGPDAARLAGVNTGRMTLIAFVAVGGAAALGGILITSQVGAATPDIGGGYLLPVIAAVFLGTTQIKPGKFNVGGTVLALFLLATGVEGLQLAGGGQSWINDAFNGVALLFAVSLAALTQRGSAGAMISRLRGSRRRPGTTEGILPSPESP